MTTPSKALRVARERSEKTEKEIAEAVGINTPSYYDLEDSDDEFFVAASLNGLGRLCATLKLGPESLLGSIEHGGDGIRDARDLGIWLRDYMGTKPGTPADMC